MEIEERFWNKVDWGDESRCWPWLATIDQGGYGHFSIHRYPVYAHRVAYELETGDIPAGFEIDHLCKNRCCVNPAHLEAVSPHENKRRSGCWEASRLRHARNRELRRAEHSQVD